MRKRNDIHRPSAINPTEYQFVALSVPPAPDLESIRAVLEQRAILKAHMDRTGGQWAHHQHGGTCHVCGACAIYMCVYHHQRSNSYIKTGFDCAQKMDMAYGDMNGFRRAIENAREAVAGKKKAQAILSDLNLSRVWELCESMKARRQAEQEAFEAGNCEPRPNIFGYEEITIEDIVGKLVKYGSVSEKQIGFVRTLLDRIDNRSVLAAQREAERASAADCPTGRITITGTVLGMKTEENNWGIQTKILVRDETGFKVWGSRFANVEKGDTVKFVATVTPSKSDAKFGFFKRPTRSLPELSAEDKKAVKILRRVSSRLRADFTGNASAIRIVDSVTQTIKDPTDEYTKLVLQDWTAQ